MVTLDIEQAFNPMSPDLTARHVMLALHNDHIARIQQAISAATKGVLQGIANFGDG